MFYSFILYVLYLHCLSFYFSLFFRTSSTSSLIFPLYFLINIFLYQLFFMKSEFVVWFVTWERKVFQKRLFFCAVSIYYWTVKVLFKFLFVTLPFILFCTCISLTYAYSLSFSLPFLTLFQSFIFYLFTFPFFLASS